MPEETAPQQRQQKQLQWSQFAAETASSPATATASASNDKGRKRKRAEGSSEEGTAAISATAGQSPPRADRAAAGPAARAALAYLRQWKEQREAWSHSATHTNALHQQPHSLLLLPLRLPLCISCCEVRPLPHCLRCCCAVLCCAVLRCAVRGLAVKGSSIRCDSPSCCSTPWTDTSYLLSSHSPALLK